MTYEERKRLVSGWLFDFLKRYEVPSHLDENAIRKEMVLMVEDINSEIPELNEGGFKHHLEKISSYVRKHQATRKWPTISMFVKAAEHCRSTVSEDHLENKGRNDWNDPLRINAIRIQNKESVPEYYINGTGADLLLSKGYVRPVDLLSYKKYLDVEKSKLYANGILVD